MKPNFIDFDEKAVDELFYRDTSKLPLFFLINKEDLSFNQEEMY